MEQCLFLGVYEFPGGTCAQWFSGTATALAVAVALGAHFYTAWRQRMVEARQDAAEIAGISMLMRSLLSDAKANAVLFFKNCRNITLLGEKYTLSRNLGAVRAVQHSLLRSNQADVLLREGKASLAEFIDHVVWRANLANLGIEDYARIRLEAASLVEQHVRPDIEKTLNKESEEAKTLATKLFILSDSADHFLKETKALLEEVILLVTQFNGFCQEHEIYTKYQIPTGSFSALVAELEAGIPEVSFAK